MTNDKEIALVVEWLRDQAITILGKAQTIDDIDLSRIEFGATVLEYAADSIEAREYERTIEQEQGRKF